MPKFKVGDRVQRDPKIWGDYTAIYNHGVITHVFAGSFTHQAYLFLADADKDGVRDPFSGKIEPSNGKIYHEIELVPE